MGWTVRISNPGGEQIFRTCPDRPWGPLSLLYNGYRVFPRGKAGGVWRWPPTPSRAEVKERVELHLYSPSNNNNNNNNSWPVIGWNLPLVNYLLTYLLTYSTVQSPSWAANWFAAGQEILRISRNPKVHYRTHKGLPPVSILGQPNLVHIPTFHLLQIHPNIIHPSTPRSPQWSPSLRFPHQDPIRRSLFIQTRHMPSLSHSSRFYHPHSIGWAVQII